MGVGSVWAEYAVFFNRNHRRSKLNSQNTFGISSLEIFWILGIISSFERLPKSLLANMLKTDYGDVGVVNSYSVDALFGDFYSLY